MNIELIWNPKLLSDIFAVDKLNNPASIIHQIRIDRNRNNDKIIILTLEQYQEPWPPIPPNLGHTFISILGQCWLTNHTFWTDQNRWKIPVFFGHLIFIQHNNDIWPKWTHSTVYRTFNFISHCTGLHLSDCLLLENADHIRKQRYFLFCRA